MADPGTSPTGTGTGTGTEERTPEQGQRGTVGRHRDDAAQRGSLVVKESVLEKIATIAAREVPGVVEGGSGLGRSVGRALPRASASVSGTRARVEMQVAVRWPVPLARTARSVHDAVVDQLTRLGGVSVDSVDVRVADVRVADPRGTEETTTRRVQ